MSEPFTAYAFRVEILLPGARAPLCDAAFAECDGLELRFDVRTLADGDAHGRQRLVAGPASYGEVTLRRGMTASTELWDWCALVVRDPRVRADARIVVLGADGATERARFLLSGCLPVRLRGPRLDAVHGVVAIEELQLACETIALDRPGPTPRPRPVATAELVELEPDHARERGRPVPLQHSPSRLHVSRDEHGRATLTFGLTFDAGGEEDVRRLTGPVTAFAGRPAVRFRWGAFRFDGRITALEEALDLFAADGRPLRADLALTLREAQPTRRAPT